MEPRDEAIRIAGREGLCSVSNNSRWQKLIPLLADIPCEKRIKYIDSDEPTRWQRGVGQPHPRFIEPEGGPEELKFVEWLEIRRVETRMQGALVADRETDHSDSIRRLFGDQRAVFKETRESFVIFGYTRSGA